MVIAATICNSTIIEMYEEIVRISQGLKGCQMLRDMAKSNLDFSLLSKFERFLRFSRLMKNLSRMKRERFACFVPKGPKTSKKSFSMILMVHRSLYCVISKFARTKLNPGMNLIQIISIHIWFGNFG